MFFRNQTEKFNNRAHNIRKTYHQINWEYSIREIQENDPHPNFLSIPYPQETAQDFLNQILEQEKNFPSNLAAFKLVKLHEQKHDLQFWSFYDDRVADEPKDKYRICVSLYDVSTNYDDYQDYLKNTVFPKICDFLNKAHKPKDFFVTDNGYWYVEKNAKTDSFEVCYEGPTTTYGNNVQQTSPNGSKFFKFVTPGDSIKREMLENFDEAIKLGFTKEFITAFKENLKIESHKGITYYTVSNPGVLSTLYHMAWIESHDDSLPFPESVAEVLHAKASDSLKIST